MTEKELIERVTRNMPELLDGLKIVDFKVEVPLAGRRARFYADMIITVKVGNSRKKLVLEFKHRAYASEIQTAIHQLKLYTTLNEELVPVLVAPYISEGLGNRIREQCVNYLDLSGNVYIAFDNVLIHKTAARNAFVTEKPEASIFSDKASLVMRELVARSTEFMTIREIAAATGNSVGWTSEILNQLEERGHLDRRPRAGCKIRRVETLLDDWTDQYTFLKRNRVRNFFIRAESQAEILAKLQAIEIPKEIEYALTLQSGAYLVAPFVRFNECHVYVEGTGDFNHKTEYFVEALGLAEPPAGGNFHVVRPYYKRGVFFQARDIDGLTVVSDLQLYLDLAGFPIRGREQAQKVLEHSGLATMESWR